ncbi:radical SAM protein [Phorcysia thermohydrogeniphila]|uniref:23S rRNA (Adenine2503-C2)-methyltransferase n=1 Tax=Phorcysia thermohydrogeniphila TaxID=936138 RepID=A0A4R1G5Y6_9BACT|nr:radical SAM protein [Phorcysia thermohydrogeniphila]TCK03367.1 23S rRNA (adenine2503-C2)-methyltransferase [Phorcysia thermohydrogeniphila]
MRIVKELRSPLNRLFIYETSDGYRVESVFYKGERLCISTQVGCPIGCAFCASGSKGFFRNLSFEEIVAQYELLKEKLPIKGIAIAGIGEPALNVENVARAVNYFRERGLKVTISTTGYPIEGFKELIRLNHNGLTLSVHGIKEETRKKIFKKIEKLEELLNAIEEHLSTSSSSRRKKFQLGYLLIKDLNDDRENLKLLAETALKHRFTVMLMMYNEVEGKSLKAVTKEEYERTFLFLRSFGVRVTLSNRFRTDKLGGCGTLTIARRV